MSGEESCSCEIIDASEFYLEGEKLADRLVEKYKLKQEREKKSEV